MESIEHRILQVLQSSPENQLEDQLLTVALKDVDETQKVSALNRLIEHNRILLLMSSKGLPVYKYQSEEQASKLRDLAEEDVRVFQLIEESRDRGIQIVDIKSKLLPQGFNAAIITKSLKSLEKKGLVKKIKSLQQKNKQVWMLMEVEPAPEVTGGLCGQENFDLELIEVIQERILEYLKKQGQTSYRELTLHVKQMGIMPSGHEFRDEDIKQIIQVLVYDQKIELVSGGGIGSADYQTYKLSNVAYHQPIFYSQSPCAHCPVRRECGPDNLVNPKSCPYLAQWLSI